MVSFREKVIKVVKKIPKGDFLTYQEVTKLAGNPRAWRTVGNILNKNQNPKIPCHRVIRSNGRIGGYRYGAKKKINLLKREGIIIDIPHRKRVGRTLRFSRIGKQSGFARVRNRGFLKSKR